MFYNDINVLVTIRINNTNNVLSLTNLQSKLDTKVDI